jgi:hypothetical protein
MNQPRAFPDEILILLGEIFVRWSRIEHNLRWLVGLLAEVDPPTGESLFNRMSMSKLLTTASELGKTKLNTGDLLALNTWLKTVENGNVHRNDLVHSQWSYIQLNDEYVPVKTNLNKEKEKGQYRVSFTTEVEPLIQEVLILIKKIEEDFLSLPERLREHKIESDAEGILQRHRRTLD